MASIYPFRAWRYNPSEVRLSDVVTQPYDKISPAMQQAYYQRSPYNLVRIILGLPELFDAERGESVYTRAARDLNAWKEQGVLTQEKEPCIFAYAQRFRVPGTDIVKERRGFIALGKLHERAKFSEAANRPFDRRAHRKLLLRLGPWVAQRLLQPQRHPPFAHIHAKDHHLDCLTRLQQVAGLANLLRPRHLREMNHPLDPRLQLHKRAKVRHPRHRAANSLARRVLPCHRVPRMRLKLLQPQ